MAHHVVYSAGVTCMALHTSAAEVKQSVLEDFGAGIWHLSRVKTTTGRCI